MKIGVVGCGALGSYYGACLSRIGEEVHFLLRSDYETVRAKGVKVLTPAGDFEARPICARTPAEIGVCDLVLIGLKTTANAQFRELLSPLAGPQTRFLTLQNGLGNEEALAAVFGPERVLGGLCFVCLNRLEAGLIRHSGYGRVVLGEYQRSLSPGAEQLVGLFRRAGISCDGTANLAEVHWDKLVWNIPFNGLGTASAAGYESVVAGELRNRQQLPCLTTDLLLDQGPWEELVRALMAEVIATARALGLPLDAARAEHQIERTHAMGAYKASTLIDYEQGKPLELESMFLRPLRHAHECGVRAPRLEALCQLLAIIDPGREFPERRFRALNP